MFYLDIDGDLPHVPHPTNLAFHASICASGLFHLMQSSSCIAGGKSEVIPNGRMIHPQLPPILSYSDPGPRD